MNQKAINVVHKLQILDAEMQTIEPKKSREDTTLAPLYDKAIASATKAGFLQDAALAAQLASYAVQDERDSREYFRRSCELYQSWGAKGVVDYLERSSDSTSTFHIESSSPLPSRISKSRTI